jgi:hypothetical protein
LSICFIWGINVLHTFSVHVSELQEACASDVLGVVTNSCINMNNPEFEIMSPIPPICQLRTNSPVVKSSIKSRFRDAIKAVVAGYVLRDVVAGKYA